MTIYWVLVQLFTAFVFAMSVNKYGECGYPVYDGCLFLIALLYPFWVNKFNIKQ